MATKKKKVDYTLPLVSGVVYGIALLIFLLRYDESVTDQWEVFGWAMLFAMVTAGLSAAMQVAAAVNDDGKISKKEREPILGTTLTVFFAVAMSVLIAASFNQAVYEFIKAYIQYAIITFAGASIIVGLVAYFGTRDSDDAATSSVSGSMLALSIICFLLFGGILFYTLGMKKEREFQNSIANRKETTIVVPAPKITVIQQEPTVTVTPPAKTTVVTTVVKTTPALPEIVQMTEDRPIDRETEGITTTTTTSTRGHLVTPQ